MAATDAAPASVARELGETCEATRRERDALRAENARHLARLEEMARQADVRRRTNKRLLREREEARAEVGVLRGHLLAVCDDAARVAPFRSVERARALLATERPCAACDCARGEATLPPADDAAAVRNRMVAEDAGLGCGRDGHV